MSSSIKQSALNETKKPGRAPSPGPRIGYRRGVPHCERALPTEGAHWSLSFTPRERLRLRAWRSPHVAGAFLGHELDGPVVVSHAHAERREPIRLVSSDTRPHGDATGSRDRRRERN